MGSDGPVVDAVGLGLSLAMVTFLVLVSHQSGKFQVCKSICEPDGVVVELAPPYCTCVVGD